MIVSLSAGRLSIAQEGPKPSEADAAFLEENARKSGVVRLASGLQYKVLKPGSGKKPKKSDTVLLHYRGTYTDGREFDSSYTSGKPATCRLDETMPAWREALVRMKKGAKWELYVPAGLGYTRKRGTRYTRRGLLSARALVFQLELVSVTAPAIASIKRDKFSQRSALGPGGPPILVYWTRGASSETEAQTFFSDNARFDSVISVPSGLQYRVLRRGNGWTPGASDKITVHYRGTLSDGTEFYSSHKSGGPVTFRLDQAIPGWQEALQKMEEGAKWEVYVPPHLAYKKPALLADQTVIFEIELLMVDTPAGAETDVATLQPGTGSTAEQRIATSSTQAPFASVEPEQQATTSPRLPADRSKQAAINLPSGLQYKVLRSGTGRRPQPTDTLTVRYREQSAAGKASDPTYHSEGQTTFRLDRAIPGWQAAFAEMEEGARWEFRVPSGLAFSKWGSPDVDMRIFEVELLTVSAADESQTAAGSARAFLDANAREAGMISLPGGLQYRVVEDGQGTKPQRGDLVTLRFRGTLLDGRFFDNAYHSEGRETFRLDGAIPAWQDALQRMREGDKWELYMPSEFAFSEWGPRGGDLRGEVGVRRDRARRARNDAPAGSPGRCPAG